MEISTKEKKKNKQGIISTTSPMFLENEDIGGRKSTTSDVYLCPSEKYYDICFNRFN